ncbi:hypothetical protein B0H63DRAFT_9525 [Podospora didyma]|uniref:Uncharacterized protein n=1 Tax=Podospora didyma TaxID=330526 RepID=A0AAE0P4E5_9PEZI|nr:hypothetical protein B0H63DRAFT_9525 [Podospora didyma]
MAGMKPYYHQDGRLDHQTLTKHKTATTAEFCCLCWCLVVFVGISLCLLVSRCVCWYLSLCLLVSLVVSVGIISPVWMGPKSQESLFFSSEVTRLSSGTGLLSRP